MSTSVAYIANWQYRRMKNISKNKTESYVIEQKPGTADKYVDFVALSRTDAEKHACKILCTLIEIELNGYKNSEDVMKWDHFVNLVNTYCISSTDWSLKDKYKDSFSDLNQLFKTLKRPWIEITCILLV